MAFSENLSYTQYTNKKLDLPVVAPGSPTEPVTATLVMPNTLELSTSNINSTASSFIDKEWKAVGTKTEVNALLNDVFLLPGASTANFSITVLVLDSLGNTIESGSYTVTGTAIGVAPVVTLIPTFIGVGAGSGSVSTIDILPVEFTTVNLTNRATVKVLSPGAGTLLAGEFGAAQSVLSEANKTLTIYGRTEEVQAALANIKYVRTTTEVDFLLEITIFSNSASVVDTISMEIDQVEEQASQMTAGFDYYANYTNVVPSIVITDPNIADTFTARLTMSTGDDSKGSFTVGTFGATTSTWTAITGVWEAAAGTLTDVNAALADVEFLAANDTTDTWTAATFADDDQGTTTTGTWDPTNLAAAGLATNEDANFNYFADFTNDLPDLIIDIITPSTVTSTLTFSTNDSSKGTLTTGTFGSTTSTYTAGTGVWSASGTPTDVNAALAAVQIVAANDIVDTWTINTSLKDDAASVAALTGSWDPTNVDTQPSGTNLTLAQDVKESLNYELPDIVITDPDPQTVTFDATLTMSTNNDDPGTLSTGTFGSTTSTWTAITGVWAASGTLADVNAALADVDLTVTAGYLLDFDIDISFTDNITAPNTAGQWNFTEISIAPIASNMNEAYIFESGLDVDLTNIVITDPDSHNVFTAKLTFSTADATPGEMTTGTFGSTTSTWTAGTGVWQAVGTLTDVNSALADTVYSPIGPEYITDFTIATSIDDGIFSAVTGTLTMTYIQTYILFGIDTSPGGSPLTLKTTDLSTWTTITDPLEPADVTISAAVRDDGDVIHAFDSTSSDKEESNNTGNTWSNPQSTGFISGSVTYDNGTFVINSASGSDTRIRTSTDGDTFTSRLTVTSFGIAGGSAYNGSNLWVACFGDIIPDAGKIYTASDATSTWIERTPAFTDERLDDVAYGNAIFVIIGSGGSIQSSTNGTTWTERTSASSATTGGKIVYDGTNFIIIHNSSEIQTSANGITWSARTNPISWAAISELRTYDGVSIALGSGTKMISSANGTTWTDRTPSLPSNISLGRSTAATPAVL